MFSKKEIDYLNYLILSKLEDDCDFEDVVEFKRKNDNIYDDILSRLKDKELVFNYVEKDDDGNGFDFNIKLWSENNIIKSIGIFKD
jgi:hypothetical protein